MMPHAPEQSEQPDPSLVDEAIRLQEEEYDEIRVGGLLVNYEQICHRKVWLASHQVSLERESDRVALGRVLHQQAYRHLHIRELYIDNLLRIDLVDRTGEIVEIKASPKYSQAARLQLLYYLYALHRAGVPNLKGELRYPQQRRVEEVHLTPEAVKEVEEALRRIAAIRAMPKPPAVSWHAACRSCAFQDLCWG